MSKKWMFTIIILILFPYTTWAIPAFPTIPSFPTIAGTGSTYYVNKDTGNNENSGADGDEWATITYGISKLSAGDTLIVEKAATAYDETFDINLTGTSSQWITIQGKSGERPEINNNDDTHLIRFGNSSSASYIYFRNFDLVHGSATYAAVKFSDHASHIVIDDLDIDGSQHAVFIGNTIGSTGAHNIYMRNIIAHDTSDSCFQYYARSGDIVAEGCEAYNSSGDDGFGSHLAGSGDTWKNIGPPNDDDDTLGNLYFIDCVSHDNHEEGFDLAAVRGVTYIKNAKVYHNGSSGIKLWGLTVWVVNSLVYENSLIYLGNGGITVKPIWENSPYYIIGNTLVNNVKDQWNAGELTVVPVNDSYTLKTPLLYLYNNIFMPNSNGKACIVSAGSNISFAEGNGNLYYKSGDNTYGYVRHNKPINNDILESFKIDEMSDGTWYASKGIDQKCVSSIDGSDPGFTNLGIDDYTLTGTSIAVDAGVDIGIPYDIRGISRPQVNGYDIGAYEHQSGEPAIPPKAPEGLQIR